ncbi:MAG: gamma-glutamylcyclotransferase family protein [bacterium]
MFRVKWNEKTLAMLAVPKGSRTPKDLAGDANLTFVWGLLMDPDFIKKLLGHRVAFAPATLKGCARSAEGKGFSLRKKPGGIVNGVVLVGLSREDVFRLNEFEEAPTVMARRRTDVYVGDEKVKAFIYLKRK